jgi:hypothetical protein
MGNDIWTVRRAGLAHFELLRCLCSGVFSTGAMGAIAPVILRKRPIAPVILHLNHLIVWTLIHIRYLFCNLLDTDNFFEMALKFLLRETYLHFIINVKRVCILHKKRVQVSTLRFLLYVLVLLYVMFWFF